MEIRHKLLDKLLNAWNGLKEHLPDSWVSFNKLLDKLLNELIFAWNGLKEQLPDSWSSFEKLLDNLLKELIFAWSGLKEQLPRSWSSFKGRKALYFVTTGLMILPAGFIFLALAADWQVQRLDVNLIPEMEESSRVYDRNGKEFCQFWRQKRTMIPLSQISSNLQKAILAMEDRSFYNHHGYDLGGILRAMMANLQAGKIEQGGSTLTQQLAKNSLLTAKRSYWRKLQELWLARRIEKRYSKTQILVLYLNRIYWGSGFYGVEAAA